MAFDLLDFLLVCFLLEFLDSSLNFVKDLVSFDLFQVSLSSNIFPSVDLTYIEDKYSGLSTQALLNVWSALKGRRGMSRKFNNTKVNNEVSFWNRVCLKGNPDRHVHVLTIFP